MENVLFEDISVFLPKYLSPEEQRDLFDELRRFPENKNFYLPKNKFPNDLLQGDGWKGFVAINFDTLKKKNISGIVLSNSCDIDTQNKRDIKPNILFAPIIKLSGYMALLKAAGKKPEEIEDKLTAVRKQEVTSIFYLPQAADLIEESIIVLDDVHRHPLEHFSASNPAKLFTLNQFAFYLFLMKLSIHLTRLGEGIHRS